MNYQIFASFQNQQVYAELQDVLLDLNVELVALTEIPIAEKTLYLLLIEAESDLCRITDSLTDEFRQLPKIAILHSDRLSRNQIYQAGFQDYLLHPFVKEEVLYRIITSIRQSSAAGTSAHFSVPNIVSPAQSWLPITPVPNFTNPLTDAVTSSLSFAFTQNSAVRIGQQQLLIQKACAYMQANMGKRLTLALVAKQTGTSRTKLAELFQSMLNMTVFEWLRQHRMMRAESLLLQSNLQIQQIAYEVGYDNPANFATCYRQHFQRSPSASRKNRTLEI